MRPAASWLGSARLPLKMAAAEAAAPGGGGCPPAGGGSVPVLFCFSVFARPSSVPHGAGYELLIQKFLSLYGDQIDMHRKFVVQLFAEEWSQYIDLPKGFLVSERCKLRLVPLQIQVRPGGGAAPAATGVCACGAEEGAAPYRRRLRLPPHPSGEKRRPGGPGAGGSRGHSPANPPRLYFSLETFVLRKEVRSASQAFGRRALPAVGRNLLGSRNGEIDLWRKESILQL